MLVGGEQRAELRGTRGGWFWVGLGQWVCVEGSSSLQPPESPGTRPLGKFTASLRVIPPGSLLMGSFRTPANGGCSRPTALPPGLNPQRSPTPSNQ